MLHIILQIVDSTKPIVQAAAKAAAEVPHTSLFDLILKGGWLMIPIALLFFGTIYFFVERLLIITKANKIEEGPVKGFTVI